MASPRQIDERAFRSELLHCLPLTGVRRRLALWHESASDALRHRHHGCFESVKGLIPGGVVREVDRGCRKVNVIFSVGFSSQRREFAAGRIAIGLDDLVPRQISIDG